MKLKEYYDTKETEYRQSHAAKFYAADLLPSTAPAPHSPPREHTLWPATANFW